MEADILKTVMSLVAKYADCPLNDLNPNTKLSDTGIESIGVAELIFDLESEYDITIEDTDDIQGRFNLGTLSDVAKLITQKTLETA